MNERHTSTTLILVTLALIAASLACGRQTTLTPQITVATPTLASAAEVQPTAPPEPTLPPEPTSTPVPGGCADGMHFVADVTVPDGTRFGPNEHFIKTWRVRNSGSCDWAGYRILFDSGEPLGTLDQPILDTTAGQEMEISVEMTSPGGPGNYTGRWRIQSPAGANLGTLSCVIVVEGEEGSLPTVEPTEEPTEELTGQADLVIEDVSVWSPLPTSPETVQIILTVSNIGGGQAGAFSLIWYPHQASDEVGCSIDIAGLSPGVSLVEDCSYTYVEHGEMHWRAVADAYNEVDESPNEDNNEQRGAISINAGQPEPTTVTLQSLPAEDGYVRGVTGGESISLNGDVRVGDGKQNQGQQAFFSFDISGIPQGATIQEAALDLSNHTSVHDPFVTLELLGVYFVQYGALDTGDYVAGWPTGRAASLSSSPTILNPIHNLQQLVNEGAARFQVRLQFQGITDNDDQVDALVFPEGGPALTITYVP